MKKSAKYNRSQVMKAAWTIFRKYKVKSMANWSKALKKAWAWIKSKTADYTLYVESVAAITDKAIKVKVDAGMRMVSFWLPKSQISGRYADFRIGSDDQISLPAWLAQKIKNEHNILI